MSDEKRIIEIDGVKMEVDLRTAKTVDTFKVGASVKFLKKKYSNYEMYPAVIVGFTEFKKMPCIELLAMDTSGNITFELHSSESDSEIAPFNSYEALFSKTDILEKLDRKVNSAEEDLRHAIQKREAFVNNFAKVFEKELV